MQLHSADSAAQWQHLACDEGINSVPLQQQDACQLVCRVLQGFPPPVNYTLLCGMCDIGHSAAGS